MQKNLCLFLALFFIGDLTVGGWYTATHPRIRIPSAAYDHDFRPNAQAIELWGKKKICLYTNSLGFRDAGSRSVSLKKQSSRILLIGDSFTEGIGIPYEKTFAGILDHNLRPQGIEVLNAGVASYYPKLYLQKIQYWIQQGLELDEVIVFLDISDIPDEVDNLFPMPVFTQTRIAKNAVRSFLEARFLSFRLLFTLKFRLWDWPRLNQEVLAFNKRRVLWPQDPEVFKEYGIPGLELARRHMTSLLEYLQSRNIKLSVAVYPWPVQIQTQRQDLPQVVYWEKWCKEKQIPFFNFFPYFLKQPYEQVLNQYFIPGDVHWGEKGHALIAEHILSQKKISPA